MRPRLTNILLLGAALAAGMLLARRLLIRRIEGPARPLLTGPWPRRLYHLPGMLAYDRTHPDRCYPSPEAAETDGFTRAKR
jgi:hypothetical protein